MKTYLIGRMAFVFMALLAFSVTSMAKGLINTSYPDNVAIKGYDPVAYFVDNKPVQGNEKFSTEYKDATWYFANAENLEKFKENPEKYAPQYGGYCAYTMSKHGQLSRGDPEIWKIVNNKLYLNCNKRVQQLWLQDLKENIIQGDKNYSDLQKKYE